MPVDFLIVGGGPTAQSAAAAYRSAGGRGQVVLVSADDTAPYDRPPLSKAFLRGEAEVDELPIEPPDWYSEQRVDLRLSTEVAALDPADHAVTTADGETIEYRQCLMATGSEPGRLSVPGADRALALRSLTQARKLRAGAEQSRRAVVVGSGFIGCEAAASLAARGLRVTMVSTESKPQQSRLGDALAGRLAGWLADDGVNLIGDAAVSEITEAATILDDGREIPADLVLAAVGVRPRGEVAERAGLAMTSGRVLVGEDMRTSDPDVLAAGDVAFARNGAVGRSLAVEHWGEAIRMGEVAGRNAAGGVDRWAQVPGFWSEIGSRTLKYAAWGDGFDDAILVPGAAGAFTVWYRQNGAAVGVLTHRADEDDELGHRLIEAGAPPPL